MNNQQNNTARLAKMAMLVAISIVLVMLIHFPIFPAVAFKEYDPADIPILIGTFAFGPAAGVVLTVVTGVLIGLITGNAWMSGADYVNLSMFFAFAVLYPETRFLIMFIIPVKVKWLAIVDGVLFAVGVLGSLLRLDVLGALVPIIALLNFFVFFWTDITGEISYRRGRAKHQTSRQTIQFKSAVRQQKQKEAERGYRHKCAVCGRTDTDYPDLEFRYCSRCAGYHCFCQDHIFNHEHFTE